MVRSKKRNKIKKVPKLSQSRHFFCRLQGDQLNDLEKSVNILVLMFALQISKELVREKFFAEDDLFCATVHKEHEKNGSELRPSHFVFAAFNHGKTDTGNTRSISKFGLREIEHLSQRNKIRCEDLLVFFDFLIGEYDHVCIVFQCNNHHAFREKWVFCGILYIYMKI